MNNYIDKSLNNIFNKTGFIVDYDIKLFNGNPNKYGYVNKDRVIYINSVVSDILLVEKIIYHEYLHLKLELDSNLMFDILAKKYYQLYRKYLDIFVGSYHIEQLKRNVICWDELSFDEKKVKSNQIKANNRISNYYTQFFSLNEFIVHNSDYWYISNFKNTIYDDILDMNQHVYNLIINNL